jgi:hypothetical protein
MRITFDTAKELASTLPGVEEGRRYGTRALLVGGELFAVRAIHRSAEPNSMSAMVGFDKRQQLIAKDPDVYYLKKHYINYPVVLVRLSRIQPEALRALLRTAHRFVSTHGKRPARRPARRTRTVSRRGGSTRR